MERFSWAKKLRGAECRGKTWHTPKRSGFACDSGHFLLKTLEACFGASSLLVCWLQTRKGLDDLRRPRQNHPLIHVDALKLCAQDAKHNRGWTFSTLYMLMLNTEQSNMEIISLRQLLISISRKHCISIHLSCDSGLLITAWVQYPPSF